MTSHRDLGARLVELEPVNPSLRGPYEQALRDVLERKLSVTMKVFIGCIGAMSLGIAVFLGSMAVIHHQLPALARIGLGGGTVFSLAWTALTVMAGSDVNDPYSRAHPIRKDRRRHFDLRYFASPAAGP